MSRPDILLRPNHCWHPRRDHVIHLPLAAALRGSRDLPDLQNKSALEGDFERRASLCADVVHRNAGMQFNENEAAALFDLEHA